MIGIYEAREVSFMWAPYTSTAWRCIESQTILERLKVQGKVESTRKMALRFRVVKRMHLYNQKNTVTVRNFKCPSDPATAVA